MKERKSEAINGEGHGECSRDREPEQVERETEGEQSSWGVKEMKTKVQRVNNSTNK